MANLGTIFPITLLLISVYQVQVAQGFNCYWCSYWVLDGQEFGDQSCAPGRVPDDQFLVNCDELKESGFASSMSNSWNNNLTGILAAPSDQQEGTTGCVFTHGVGLSVGKNYSGVYRGCYWAPQPMFENCEKKRHGTWYEGEDDWSIAVYGIYYLAALDRDGVVDACMCNDEGCNTDIGSEC